VNGKLSETRPEEKEQLNKGGASESAEEEKVLRKKKKKGQTPLKRRNLNLEKKRVPPSSEKEKAHRQLQRAWEEKKGTPRKKQNDRERRGTGLSTTEGESLLRKKARGSLQRKKKKGDHCVAKSRQLPRAK